MRAAGRLTARPAWPGGHDPCPCSPAVPAFASKRTRRPPLVHISCWDYDPELQPDVLCGARQHAADEPSRYSAITCVLCLRLWDRGYRRRATLLRSYPVPGRPGQFYTLPDVPPAAVN